MYLSDTNNQRVLLYRTGYPGASGGGGAGGAGGAGRVGGVGGVGQSRVCAMNTDYARIRPFFRSLFGRSQCSWHYI